MDIESELDPEVALFLSNSPVGALDFGSLQFSDLPALREAMANMPKPEPPPTRTVYRDQAVPGPAGGPDVTLRIYTVEGRSPDLPCLYWIHGGGYMFGSALADDTRLSRWTEELELRGGVRRVPPGARVSLPGAPRGLLRRAAVDRCPRRRVGRSIPTRLVIGGASAGAGLAAGLALLARDRGEVAIAHQLLIYPMIDDRHANVSSGFAAPIWNRAPTCSGGGPTSEAWPTATRSPSTPPPARAKELSGLPPATVVVGTIDVFRDEDIDYSFRLLAAGVTTEFHVYPGAPHGFEMLAASTAVAQRCQRDLDDALQRAFRPPHKESAAGSR